MQNLHFIVCKRSQYKRAAKLVLTRAVTAQKHPLIYNLHSEMIGFLQLTRTSNRPCGLTRNVDRRQ